MIYLRLLIYFFPLICLGQVHDSLLIKRLDSLANEDQKWRNLLTRFRNNEIPKDSINPSLIVKNFILTDRSNYPEVRKIFDKYGFPNYDLVGRTGSNNFWLLVQHQDLYPNFQDSVLTSMKIQVDSGKASKKDYAYLIDRVKLNLGQKQVYGTQMQMNESKNSYEPKPVIDIENLNQRRQSVGLSSIEDYIKVMNRRHHIADK